MGMLTGKNIFITGLTLDTSIGFAAAKIALAEGANVIVSNLGRGMSLSRRVVKKLSPEPALVELDVTDAEQLAQLPQVLAENGFDHVDGIVHSIAFANPKRALGGAFLSTEWDDVATSLHTSVYSLKSLTMALRDMLRPGASVVGLTFDASVTWPSYDWMGVAKAGLESTSRYLARYLGPDQIRCNLVAAGPIDTVAKTAIPGGDSFNDIWAERAPLGWDPKDADPVGKAIVVLLSDWLSATTGEILHVDGGLHSTGA